MARARRSGKSVWAETVIRDPKEKRESGQDATQPCEAPVPGTRGLDSLPLASVSLAQGAQVRCPVSGSLGKLIPTPSLLPEKGLYGDTFSWGDCLS